MAEDVERIRREFFRRTRRPTILLYVGSVIAAAILLGVAVTQDAGGALLALGLGFAVSVVLFVLSPLLPTSARTARALVWLGPVAGVAAAQAFDLGELGSGAFVLGAFGGFLAGMVVGVAAIRRRLAHDDELLLRQKRLGFDPERPYGWLRGED